MKKLLSVAIPCYNSENYMRHAIESVLPGGDDVEILIVNDGSKDGTAEIADEYEQRYPDIVRAIHKENGGHGDAVMAGLRVAQGLYFRVVDSDDWLDTDVLAHVLKTLREHTEAENQIDLLITDYIYDKVNVKKKHVVRYANALPTNQVFDWEHMHNLKVGQYILMHAATYRRQLLLDCGLELPKHTFYVDNLYVYVPMVHVKSMMYMDEVLYHYYIGREDQSVHENVMIQRIDQQLKVNRLMIEAFDVMQVEPVHCRNYMYKYLEIITTISSVMLILSGTDENLKKKDEFWKYIKQVNLPLYHKLRHGFLGFALNMHGKFGCFIVKIVYRCANKVFGFN